MDDRLQLGNNGLIVLSGISLTASQLTLGRQINLTALNAKSEPAPELVAEFDIKFSKESPEALTWAFDAWRDKSPFFPAVSDIRKLLREFRRGQYEQQQLKKAMDEKFLLEEGRKHGEVPEFGEVVKQLQDLAAKMPEPEHMKRWDRFNQKMASITQIIPGLDLSEDQIQRRREKERAECEQYRSHADNEFNL